MSMDMELTAPAEALVSREQVVRLEQEVMKLPQVELPLKHYFAKGLYAREMTIPKGTVLVGRIHKQSQISFLLKGDHSVVTDKGVVRIQAPCTIVSPAGTKRAGYAHEECIFTTVLGTELTDHEEIYDTLTAATFEEFELWLAQQRLLEGEKQ